jgi:hypothetical protein
MDLHTCICHSKLKPHIHDDLLDMVIEEQIPKTKYESCGYNVSC